MISNSKYFSMTINPFGQRLLKCFGLYGTGEADQVTPFGDDSCPVQGMDAIWAETSSDELPVIIGYINVNQMAKEGEKRFFSMKRNEDGTYSQAFYTWMKNDGTYEIGGNNDNLVRYAAINQGLQDEITKLNSELTKIQLAITSLGGTYTRLPVTLDISPSKIDEIKCL